MKQKTPQEYEDIIRKLIFANCFRSMWQPRADGKNCRMSINFGAEKISWEGQWKASPTLDIPMNYLFRKVMGYE